MPPDLSVSGGSGGIVAQCDAIRGLAGHFGAAATDTLGSAWSLHGYLIDPVLASSALFDPAGLAAFEGQLAAALDGPGGLSWVGARCGILDGELRVAAAGYEAADRLATATHDEVQGLLGLAPALGAGIGAAAHGQGAGVRASSGW